MSGCMCRGTTTCAVDDSPDGTERNAEVDGGIVIERMGSAPKSESVEDEPKQQEHGPQKASEYDEKDVSPNEKGSKQGRSLRERLKLKWKASQKCGTQSTEPEREPSNSPESPTTYSSKEYVSPGREQNMKHSGTEEDDGGSGGNSPPEMGARTPHESLAWSETATNYTDHKSVNKEQQYSLKSPTDTSSSGNAAAASGYASSSDGHRQHREGNDGGSKQREIPLKTVVVRSVNDVETIEKAREQGCQVIVHERQKLQLCGLHAVNSMFQFDYTPATKVSPEK